jgi:hypothetical protein
LTAPSGAFSDLSVWAWRQARLEGGIWVSFLCSLVDLLSAAAAATGGDAGLASSLALILRI